MVAIVGASGSGKSTLARLIFPFYDVCDGQISIDGTNISSLKQLNLEQIGIVPQDTVLFNESIYNIAYGKPDATKKDVIDVAKASKLHTFIVS